MDLTSADDITTMRRQRNGRNPAIARGFLIALSALLLVAASTSAALAVDLDDPVDDVVDEVEDVLSPTPDPTKEAEDVLDGTSGKINDTVKGISGGAGDPIPVGNGGGDGDGGSGSQPSGSDGEGSSGEGSGKKGTTTSGDGKKKAKKDGSTEIPVSDPNDASATGAIEPDDGYPTLAARGTVAAAARALKLAGPLAPALGLALVALIILVGLSRGTGRLVKADASEERFSEHTYRL